MQKHNVVIVGAGPGGGATAVRLMQNGVKDVVLLDKDQFPRDKTCGSALSPNGVALINELGLGDAVRALGSVMHSLIVTTPGNRKMKFTTEQAAIVLLRKYFDNLLVERATMLGVDFRGNHKVIELIREGTRIVGVRGKKDGEPFEIYADYVIAADGAHSILSNDTRPKHTISTLMGWWENFDYEPGTMEMVFDKNLSPLYGWMFPEAENRVNIGICIEGEDSNGQKTTRNVREIFNQFLQDHYGDRLKTATQIGKFKGHPISWCTWIDNVGHDGMIYLGEGARVTNNATGEGIYHAMQSGVFAADAVSRILRGEDEDKVQSDYLWQLRKKFTSGFLVAHAIRGMLKTPLLDWIASAYNNDYVKKAATTIIGSAMAGSSLSPAEQAAVAAALAQGQQSDKKARNGSHPRSN